MKKARKGFTLVELLIVIAILGTLTATLSISAGDATARAKAAAIVNNIEACKNGAALYYAAAFNDTSATMLPTAFLVDDSEYVPNWSSFATGGTITYTAGADTQTTPDTWTVVVSFASDKEATKIATALSKIPGYTGVESTHNTLTVLLMKGTVTGSTATATPPASNG